MKVNARLFPESDGRTKWSPEGVASLVGQTPTLRGFGTTSTTITAAWIEDGWVVVTLEEDR